jgi:hypothetical protein
MNQIGVRNDSYQLPEGAVGVCCAGVCILVAKLSFWGWWVDDRRIMARGFESGIMRAGTGQLRGNIDCRESTCGRHATS